MSFIGRKWLESLTNQNQELNTVLNLPFILLLADPDLPNSRTLAAASNITLTDGGPGNAITIDLSDTTVVPGVYNNLTVDQKGRITAGSLLVITNTVTNSDGTLTISPTSGAVVASLNLSHANTWLADQSVPDEAFGISWNGSMEVPTKNAIYDYIVGTIYADFIRIDGGSATSAEIPFAYGTLNYQNLRFDSGTSSIGVLFQESTQALFYDDGSNQAQIYLYDGSSNGMFINAVGKCSIFVDAAQNMLFTASSSDFSQASTFASTVSITGRTYITPGTSGVLKGVGGVVAYTVTQTGSSTAGAVDAWSVTVAASTLDTNGDSLSFDISISAANTANNKQFTISWGGTTIFDSTNIAAQNGDAHIRGIIVRKDSKTCYCSVFNHTSTKWSAHAKYTSVTATLSNSQIFKVTFSTATANNDVIIRTGKLKWEPTP